MQTVLMMTEEGTHRVPEVQMLLYCQRTYGLKKRQATSVGP